MNHDDITPPADQPLPQAHRAAIRRELGVIVAGRRRRWHWSRRSAVLTMSVALAAAGGGIAAAAYNLSQSSKPAVLAPTTTTTTPPTTTTTTPPTTTTTLPTLPSVWTLRTVPAGVKGTLVAVTCPTATTCFAVGGGRRGGPTGGSPASIITSTNGGDTWALAYSAPTSQLSAIACADATACMVVGSTDTGQPVALHTVDGGRHWSQESLPDQVGTLEAVACASPTVCVAGGYLYFTASKPVIGPTIVRTTNGGSTWGTVSVPTGLSVIYTVVCPTTSVCFVAGSGPGSEATEPSIVAKSTDGGETWSTPIVLRGPGLGSIVCIDVEECVGIIFAEGTTSLGQGRGATTSDGGTTWSVSSPIGDSVSCSSTMCLSVGGLPYRTTKHLWYATAFVSTTAGTTWTQVAVPTYQGVFFGVSCNSADDCVVVGARHFSSTTPVIMTYGH
jgi:photosystem II stability/assembly factor-like uncharacterized protein